MDEWWDRNRLMIDIFDETPLNLTWFPIDRLTSPSILFNNISFFVRLPKWNEPILCTNDTKSKEKIDKNEMKHTHYTQQQQDKRINLFHVTFIASSKQCHWELDLFGFLRKSKFNEHFNIQCITINFLLSVCVKISSSNICDERDNEHTLHCVQLFIWLLLLLLLVSAVKICEK